MICVELHSKKYNLPLQRFYFNNDASGAEKARKKRAELMAKYLDNEVEIFEDEDR